MIDFGFFNHDYPYTNFHEMNLDWILRQMIELRSDMRNFVNQNTIKYADPIQWNITTQYEGNTVVIEPNTGNAYISSQPVPAGVAITNEDYWSVIGNFSVLYESIKESIAAADDGSDINASEARTEGQLLWLNSKLYKVLSDISVGALYITSGAGQNLQEVTIENILNSNKNEILNMIGSLDDLDTENKSDIVSAVNEVLQDIEDYKIEYILRPDDFTGTDSEKIQSAFDALADQNGGVIVIDRAYKLTDNIKIRKRTNNPNHRYISIVGLGKDSIIDFDVYHIEGYDTSYRDYGGLRFVNLAMTGSEKAFITDNLIRISLIGCDLYLFQYIFYGMENNSCQSIFVSDCNIKRIMTCVHYADRQAWDIHYDNNQIELCDKVIDLGYAKLVAITNNVIEGRGNDPAIGKKCIRIKNDYIGLVITGNYFESNETTVDLSNCTNNYNNHAVIEGNSFWESLPDIKCVILPLSVTHSQILLSHNAFNLSGSGDYSIAVPEAGHDWCGVQINGCNGNYYDPDAKLKDIANYEAIENITKSVSMTDSASSPLKFQRHGKVCQITGVVTINENVASYNKIFQLVNTHQCPTAPMVPVSCEVGKLDSNNIPTSHVWCLINTSGEVSFFSPITSGERYIFNVVYIC